MSFNKLIVVGNLGRDPELRFTPQGTPVCTFTVASNERRKGGAAGEAQDITTWFRVTVWGKQAETVSKYLTKGRSVYVEGRLHVEEWTDKDGKPRHTLEVNASDVQFIDGANRADSASAAGGGQYRQQQGGGGDYAPARAGGGRAQQPAPAVDDEDIPF